MLQALTTILVALSMWAPAPAAAATMTSHWEADATEIASKFWAGRTGAVCSDVDFVVKNLGGNVAGEVTIGDCVYDQRGTIAIDDVTPLRGWRFFCVVSIHEWGHLLGRTHRPGAVIMNPRPNPFGFEHHCRPTQRP